MNRLKIHPQRNEIVEEQEEQKSPTIKENSVGNLEQGVIHKVLQFITVSMRILGVYFEGTDKLRTTKQYSRFYCIIVGVMMWLNAFRIFTIFTGDDKLQSVLGKVGTVVWMAIAAVVQTSCYRASQKGRILEVLQAFNTDTSSCWVKHLRVKVISCVIIAWIYAAFSVFSTAYVSFGGRVFLNIRLAPFNTMIFDSSPLTITIITSLFLVWDFYVTGSITISLIWIYSLSIIISHEFKTSTEMVHDIVKNPESAKKSIEIVRCRHQAICRMVDQIDGFICINNATYVVGFISIIILNLYGMIAYPDVRGDPFFLVVAVFWTISCVFGLIIVAHGGIMLNQSAHEIYEILHDIDLTNLNAETIGQINTFLNRLCGKPIGFTVLRIFVIDRNTILTILGLLITYFLIIIQMSPPSSENQWSYVRSQKDSTSEPPRTGTVNNSTTSFS